MANTGKYSIFDYPPGPRDDPKTYALFWDRVEAGTIRPTREFRNGQRLFRSTTR